MVISDLEAPDSPSILKFAAAAAAMIILAGCADRRKAEAAIGPRCRWRDYWERPASLSAEAPQPQAIPLFAAGVPRRGRS
jgi:hypothetical protein